MTTKAPEPFLTLGFAAIDWIEHYLVHGPGDVQGQRIELDDEFASFIVKAYRVDPSGARYVRRAFLSRSKGRNKSGLAAMLACFEALGPCRFDHFAVKGEVSAWGYSYEPGEPVGEPLVYAEVLNVATEEGQAGNTYDAIFYMLSPESCSPELLKDYGKLDVGLTRTFLPNKRGFIEPVTSADSSKDGGKSTFIVADETHLWILPRLKRLHGIMTRNLLKRRVASGWMLETSTMYAEGEESVAEGTHAYAKNRHADRALLFDHRQAADKYDLEKRNERLAALREAYGPASEWMNLEAIADSWDDPQVSEAEFRRFWLNQPVPLVKIDTALPLDAWRACAQTGSVIAGPVALAISATQDLSTVVLAAAGHREDGLLHVEVLEFGAEDDLYGDDQVTFAKRVAQVAKKHRAKVWLHPGHPAGSFIKDLTTEKVRLETLNGVEYGQACGTVYKEAVAGTLRYPDPQPELSAAVGAATSKQRGDIWVWDGEGITALVAVTHAVHGLRRTPKLGKGRVVLLAQ